MGIWRSRRDSSARGALQPGIVPVLAAGKHRSARSGACFMEYASFLAGERWSDHPACTHAGLAHLARAVNDLTSDSGRGRLAPLVPSVIGLNSDDDRLDLLLAVHAAAVSLPHAPIDRQHALAVGATVCRDALRRSTPGALGAARPSGEAAIASLVEEVDAEVQQALAAAPEARDWASRFLDRSARWQRLEVSERQTQATIAMAVDGVRSACRDFPDDRLAELLSGSIELVQRFVAASAADTVVIDAPRASVTGHAPRALGIDDPPRASVPDRGERVMARHP